MHLITESACEHHTELGLLLLMNGSIDAAGSSKLSFTVLCFLFQYFRHKTAGHHRKWTSMRSYVWVASINNCLHEHRSRSGFRYQPTPRTHSLPHTASTRGCCIRPAYRCLAHSPWSGGLRATSHHSINPVTTGTRHFKGSWESGWVCGGSFRL